MNVHQVFNSSLVSGPESLVIPNLQGTTIPIHFVLLQETRVQSGANKVAEYVKHHGFTFFEVAVRGRIDFKTIWDLAKYWKKSCPKVIHTHGPKASLFTFLAIQFLKILSPDYRPILITTHHGVRANDFIPALRLFAWIYEKVVMPHFDLCLAVCSSDRNLLIQRGLDPERVQIHWNGVDRKTVAQEHLQQERKRIRDLWASSVHAASFDKDFLVGMVARLAPEKCHDKAIEMIRILNQTKIQHAQKVKVLFFGSGALEGELKRVVAERGMQDSVYFMGYRSQIAEELLGLDLVLSLSMAEGLPIALVEAGWARRPVVATAVDGVKDLLADNSGTLVPYPVDVIQTASAIQRYIDDQNLAERIGQNLFERVQNDFSKKAWLARLLELYSSVK